MTNCLEILRRSARKIRKMLEISNFRNWWEISLYISFLQSTPFVQPALQGAQRPAPAPRSSGETGSVLSMAGPLRVERFGRRPIEPFELFTSEFGQNSVRIQENSSKIFRKFLKFEKFSTFSKVFSEIPRNFRQNRCKIRWKSVEN